eukprot:gnl/Spiro4/593_TR339_c0_g1_i1.p1 gnl/Spiro4/593_TR339_c0_g1~~gnl/Spiro4/593_TR339_c0_g1_i1.p1  ORF type:complete len:459 (+),score=97.42 gnl/Spiro4/593_TR339_c0_g1_i1:43-1419(+)
MLGRFAASSVSRATGSSRFYGRLKDKIAELLPAKQQQVKSIKEKYGDRVLGSCTVEQAYGGARDVPCLVSETSLLDAQEGIRFRGLSIPELCAALPKAKGGEEPLPEGSLWLLMTGETPSAQDVADLSADLHARSELPKTTVSLLRGLPKNMHPMTQLCMGVLSLQPNSRFAAGYQKGTLPKGEYWQATYEDSIDLIAKLPLIASEIYCHKYGRPTPRTDHSLDWAANFAQMMGYRDNGFNECLRLYLTLHTDHEGGNVSAHATHLVGSALSDPYLAFSAGMAGLAGPLHGLANQECFRWLTAVHEDLTNSGKPETAETLKEYIWATLKAGKVIPGYGHAVLRQTDPRFVAEYEFGLKHLPNDPLFKLMALGYKVIPGVLKEQGKTKNPFPNVDCGSGVLLNFYGLKEQEFYTVLFGVSRALGVLSSLVWDRGLGFPIERPKSFTSDWIQNWAQQQKP